MSFESGNPTQRLSLAYASTNVGPTTWVEVGTLSNSAKVVEIFDSGGKAMEIKMDSTAGTADGNVPMFIMPGGNGRINLNLDAGPKLYVRCAEAATTVSSGLLLINIFT